MSIIEILLIGVGLSMDAFAVSIFKGLAMPKLNIKQAIVIGIFFGGFQFLMPVIGFFATTHFASYIQHIDHWVAFILLAFIGGKMVLDAVRESDEIDDEKLVRLDIKELFVLAIATSIDALAVGISFAFLNVSIWKSTAVIGVTTFLLSIIGVVIGYFFGAKYKKKSTIVGGVILIIIGIKIIIEHLFFS